MCKLQNRFWIRKLVFNQACETKTRDAALKDMEAYTWMTPENIFKVQGQ